MKTFIFSHNKESGRGNSRAASFRSSTMADSGSVSLISSWLFLHGGRVTVAVPSTISSRELIEGTKHEELSALLTLVLSLSCLQSASPVLNQGGKSFPEPPEDFFPRCNWSEVCYMPTSKPITSKGKRNYVCLHPSQFILRRRWWNRVAYSLFVWNSVLTGCVYNFLWDSGNAAWWHLPHSWVCCQTILNKISVSLARIRQ